MTLWRTDGNQNQHSGMPPTLKKWGAYCFRLVHPFVCLFVCPSVQKKFQASVNWYDISKSITAGSFKFGQLIEDDE